MKPTSQITIIFILLFSSFQKAYPQTSTQEYKFKITGETRLPDTSDPNVDCVVEYDSLSNNHLIISAFRKDGSTISKVCCLFTGRNFKLEKKDEYSFKKELIPDGLTQVYNINNILEAEMLYENGKMTKATTFFENGNKRMSLTSKDNILNGPYKIWHENGSLSFEGNYTNNIKNGQFINYNESGTVISEGLYENGKLVSGEAVVIDQFYNNPDVDPKFKEGTLALSHEIRKRSFEMDEVKKLDDSFIKYIDIRLFIEKQGNVSKVEIISPFADDEASLIKKVFSNFSGFYPAKVEGIPVKSKLDIAVQLSKNGLYYNTEEETDTIGKETYFLVEEMPEFPGGLDALGRFIGNNIRYPVFAQENGIQGKVYVTFVIEKDGRSSSYNIAKGVHPVLNEEAIRVLKLMPRWNPGKQRGKPVRVSYTVPVGFVLQ